MPSKQEKILCLDLGIGQKPGHVTLGTLLNLPEFPYCLVTVALSSPLCSTLSSLHNQGPAMLGWN